MERNSPDLLPHAAPSPPETPTNRGGELQSTGSELGANCLNQPEPGAASGREIRENCPDLLPDAAPLRNLEFNQSEPGAASGREMGENCLGQLPNAAPLRLDSH